MFGLLVVFACMVAAILTANIHAHCWIIGGFALLFTAAIMHQLIEFKKDFSKFACPACAKDSLCEKFCTSTKIYSLIALVLSATMSLSLLSFLMLAEKYFIMIIGMDMFVFHYLFTHWSRVKIVTMPPKLPAK